MRNNRSQLEDLAGWDYKFNFFVGTSEFWVIFVEWAYLWGGQKAEKCASILEWLQI